jgi:hypothetical protein
MNLTFVSGVGELSAMSSKNCGHVLTLIFSYAYGFSIEDNLNIQNLFCTITEDQIPSLINKHIITLYNNFYII